MKSRNILFFMITLSLFCGCATRTMYATRLKAPLVFLDPDRYKTISLAPIGGLDGVGMSSALYEVIKEKTKLKVIAYESTEDKILKKMGNKNPYVKPDLILQGEYQESIDSALVGNVKDYASAIIEAWLNVELIDNKTGEILLKEKYYHGENTGNYSLEFDPQIVQVRASASRSILARKFIEDVTPSQKGSYYDAYVDSDYPELKEGHLLIMDDKFQEALLKFDALLKRAIPSKIKGHAYHGKSFAYAFEGDAVKAQKLLDQAYKENPEKGYLDIRNLINNVEHDAPILKKFK